MSNVFPKTNDLALWLNPRYVASYQLGKLHEEWCAELPYKHAVLDDLFLPAIADAIENYCRSARVERAGNQGVAQRAEWYWGPFAQLEVVHFILSPEFRAFLNTLIGETLHFKAERIPQVNHFMPGPGLPVHNDNGVNGAPNPVGVVSLLQMSREYVPGRGGELVIFEEKGTELEPVRWIAPRMNTLVAFKVCRNSYHAVADIKGEWVRRNVTFDWMIKAS